MVSVKQPNPWLKARVAERKQFHRFIDVEVEAMLARGPRGVLGVLKAGPLTWHPCLLKESVPGY